MKRKELLIRSESVYKPSSVVYGHLSRLTVTDKLKRYSRYPSDGQPYWRIPNLAAGGVYMAYRVTTVSVSSYLAFPSLPKPNGFGGLFLLHCPGSHLRLTLSGTLSYAARTFLMVFRPRDRITNSNLFLYYSTFFIKKHLIYHAIYRKFYKKSIGKTFKIFHKF